MTTASTYVYSNTAPQAMNHHRYLAEVLDGYTVSRIVGLQRNLAGLSCLEVGAGAGSIAAWLAAEVGDHGRVVATDLHPMPISPMRRLTVLAHDITAEPVPRPPYDVIHARLVLQHLPERVDVLRTLVNALVPGGTLVSEVGRQRGACGAGPFPTPSSRTGLARFRASGSPVTTA